MDVRGWSATLLGLTLGMVAWVEARGQAPTSAKVETIPLLVEKMKEGYDLVIGSRYMPGARSFDDTPITRLGNWGFTRMINVLFGARYQDAMMGYRAYRKSKFLAMQMDEDGLTFPTQGSIQFARYGHKVTEIPSDEPKRIGGVRKAKNIGTGIELVQMIAKEAYRAYVAPRLDGKR